MFTQDIVLEKVLVCLRELLPNAPEVGADSDLVNDLGIESIKMMDLLMTLEDAYDLSIPINVLMDVRTPRQLATSLVVCMENGHGAV